MKSNTIEFSKKCIPASDYVVVEIINRNDKFKVGNVLIAHSAFSNERVAFAKVVEVGNHAAEEYGLAKDDYVVLDRLATVAQTAPIALIRYENIIARTNEDNTKFSPLKGMVFVKDDRNEISNVNGVLLNYNKKLNIGKVVSMNIPEGVEVPFAVGDDVLLSKGGDSFSIGSEHVYIYKYDMICCKVVNE